MIKIFTLLSIVLFWSLQVNAQVSNDDCFTAIDLGIIDGVNPADICPDGTIGHDTTLVLNNDSANASTTPALTGCQGYTNTTSAGGNDIWYKIKAEAFSVAVFNFNPSPIDTIHLNIWYGNNCSELTACACYTFDLATHQIEYADFTGTPNMTGYIYLQFSGNRPGKTGDFGFCMQGKQDSLLCSGASVFNPVSIGEDESDERVNTYPVPVRDQLTIDNKNAEILEITDLQGRLIRSTTLQKNQKQLIQLSELSAGIYFLSFKTRQGERLHSSKIIKSEKGN